MSEVEEEMESKTKRARPSPPEVESIGDHLPYLLVYPENWNQEMESKLLQKYFNESVYPNHFVMVSIIKAAGNQHDNALENLKQAGAFSYAKNRKALLELIQDARNADKYRVDCSDDLLDTLERYAKYAFTIEDDGETMGCGSIAF
jgi:hypothetical protein